MELERAGGVGVGSEVGVRWGGGGGDGGGGGGRGQVGGERECSLAHHSPMGLFRRLPTFASYRHRRVPKLKEKKDNLHNMHAYDASDAACEI